MSSAPLLNIPGLFSPDAAIRTVSAAAIYNHGQALAKPVVSSWLSDREISRLLWGQLVTVGVAVYPVTFARIEQANGNPRLASVPDDLDAKEFELHFATEISLDILTTRDPEGEGAIARYLKRFGEGIQQVEFRCLDVDRATAILRENFGVHPNLSGGSPRRGRDSCQFFPGSHSRRRKGTDRALRNSWKPKLKARAVRILDSSELPASRARLRQRSRPARYTHAA